MTTSPKPAEPPRPEKKLTMCCKSAFGYEGGELHCFTCGRLNPAVMLDALLRPKATCLSLDCPERKGGACKYQGQGVEDEAWEIKFFDKFGADKIWVNPSKDNVDTILMIWDFIHRVEAAAESKGWKKAIEYSGEFKTTVAEARADAVREMAKELREMWSKRGYLPVYRFLQEKADDKPKP